MPIKLFRLEGPGSAKSAWAARPAQQAMEFARVASLDSAMRITVVVELVLTALIQREGLRGV